MTNYLSAIVFLIAILFFGGCETEKNITNSEIGNRYVKGKIFLSDGEQPASGAQVSMRLKSSTAFIFSKDKISYTGEISCTTSTDGYFEIKCCPDTGVYVVEATGKDDGVLIDSIIVINDREDIAVPPGTMKPMGAVRGKISTLAAIDSGDVYVLAWGMNRFATVAKDGSFIFGDLPEGEYILRFITSAAAYGSYDLAGVKISSGDTADIGAVRLPLTVLPVPVNLHAVYDTMHLTVTLTWDKPENADGLRYAVYRKKAGASSANDYEITKNIIDSNLYIDSFLVENCIDNYGVIYRNINSNKVEHGLYEYRVVSVGIDGKKSLKSNPAKVNVFPYLKFDSIAVVPYIAIKEDSSRINGNEIIFWYTEKIYESNGLHYNAKRMEIIHQYGGTWADYKKFLNILGYNEHGDVIQSIMDTLYCNDTLLDSWIKYAITDNYIYVLERKALNTYRTNRCHQYNDSIIVFARTGEKKGKWDCGVYQNCIDITGGDNDRLFLKLNSLPNIIVCNETGSVVDELAIPNNCMRVLKSLCGESFFSMSYNCILKKLFMAVELDGRINLWIYDGQSDPYIGYFSNGEEFVGFQNVNVSVNADGSVPVSFHTKWYDEKLTTIPFRFPQ